MANRRDQKLKASLGKKIRTLRKDQKISQVQLAFECDISRELLSKMENGKINTTLKTLLAIAEALDIHLKVIFDIDY